MILSSSPLSLSFHPKTLVHATLSSRSSSPNLNLHRPLNNNLLLRSIAAGALTFTLLSSPPLPSLASTDSSTILKPSVELCQEDGAIIEEDEEKPSAVITNEELVEEAWEVVNSSYIGTADVGNRPWSPEIWKRKKEYVLNGSSIPTRSKAHEVIQKMLASVGDPYTRFLPPSEFSKLARYDVSGIGLNLREIPDNNGAVKLKVLGIILDGPAHAAGVRQGDELLSVNGVNVKGKSAFDVSTMLQGPKETFVNIEVKHGNCGPIQSIMVQRQSIARTPIFYRLEKIENGNTSVGYIQIKEFNALARKDLIIALRNLKESGASYFVLDLRDNLGGLVQTGIEVAKLFLNEGEAVIYTIGRDPQDQLTVVAETPPFITNPVIVLVNNRTASASEIVATALRDNCKAVLVGQKTYGKGLIQSVFELHDGSGVVVTIGKYVTPNHKDINGNGLEPDFPQLPAPKSSSSSSPPLPSSIKPSPPLTRTRHRPPLGYFQTPHHDVSTLPQLHSNPKPQRRHQHIHDQLS